MSSALEHYEAAASGPRLGVNKVDVFSTPVGAARLPLRAIALALGAVLLVGGGYFGVTEVTAMMEASKAPVADSSVPPAVREQAAFVKKVDNLCARSFAKIKGLLFPTTLAEFGPYADQVVSINKGLYADIAALKAPKRDRKLLNKMMAGFRTEIRIVEGEMVPAIKAMDATAFQASITRLERSAKKSSGQALAYGFTECGAPRSLTG